MPQGAIGQLITFASVLDPDENYSKYINVSVGAKMTIKKLASQRGEPSAANEILALNKGKKVLPVVRDKKTHRISKRQPGLRSVTQVLRTHATIRIPGTLKKGDVLSVPAGDNRPKVTGGYAKYDTVDVSGRIGINRFDGYDPMALEIPIQFEGYADGADWIEADIQKLERMAGRGQYPGAAFGPPAVIRVSVTDNRGNIVPLIPTNYQWTPTNPNAPLYRISGIAWADGALSDNQGRRIRQQATVTVTQYTPLIWTIRSSSQRAKAKAKPKPKPKPTKSH
jgi:hypothetical protein